MESMALLKQSNNVEHKSKVPFHFDDNSYSMQFFVSTESQRERPQQQAL